jgi:hypothetical protein
MAEKDFWGWHQKKEKLNKEAPPNFHEREIWHCYLGVNIGYEQDGAGTDFMRPILVIRKFNNDIFWGIPLTRTIKQSPYYFSFTFKGQSGSAVLSQLRLIDARRLYVYKGDMRRSDFRFLRQRIKALLP